MGYSHYYSTEKCDQKTWNKFITDCKVLYKNMPKEHNGDILLLNGCFKYKAAQFNKDRIWFNGGSCVARRLGRLDGDKIWVDVDKNDLGHETFSIIRKNRETFNSCKTARKPYDLMVMAVLILYKYYFPKVKISSDGDEEDWKPAVTLVANYFPDIALDFNISNYLKEE